MPSLLPQNSHMGGYRVVRLLGKGGMAEVYEVECEKTGAPYALKVFVCEQANAVFLKKRFLAEGRLLAKFHHPRLVRVYDFGFADPEEKIPYYVMDLVLDGSGNPRTLRAAVEAGEADEACIAGWYEDLVEALAYVHGKGVVHRDVSLENAMVGPDGRAVLSDFGVAKIIDRDLRAELNLSLVTMVAEQRPLMGKAFYLSPEVRAGAPETPASDYSALGVLVFYMLNQVWYTPGANVSAMLALFDPRWQEILPALLQVEPAQRKPLPWRQSAPVVAPHRSRWPWLVGVSFLVAGVAAVIWALSAISSVRDELERHMRQADELEMRVTRYICPQHLYSDKFQGKDIRDVSWVLAGALSRGLRDGLRPEVLADQLACLEQSDGFGPDFAALTCATQWARVRLYLEARRYSEANEVYEAMPESVKPIIRRKFPRRALKAMKKNRLSRVESAMPAASAHISS